ncbi:hypothetical protein E4U60_004700 [Claviceps pazoutovae]|uniref:Uncharacterized protein n=1 Tax=Claviceps pazoutovae TaxID=1649127 RepID=A0A9P7SEI5_9HYPO|nr:hypothetical protein E4U60_004700 [Claviceps pazoutovae]
MTARQYSTLKAFRNTVAGSNGDNGLDLALCESIACLDHLGNYCFTGSKSFTQDHGEPQVRLALCVTVAPEDVDEWAGSV